MLDLLRRLYVHIIKNNNSYQREKRKIKNIPRYTFHETSILKTRIGFVDSISFINGLEEIFESSCYYFETTTKTPRIFDCGSNIGLATIYFKTLFPDSKITCFEPDPDIFRVLKRNIECYKFDGIELRNEAVWNENTQLKFRKEGGFSGRIPLKMDTNENKQVEVKAVKLAEHLDIKVDLLKLDIEGAELEVLQSIENKLNNIDKIFIEYHSPSNENQRLDEILRILKKNNFRYFIKEAYVPIHPFKEVTCLDGMDLQLNIYGINQL